MGCTRGTDPVCTPGRCLQSGPAAGQNRSQNFLIVSTGECIASGLHCLAAAVARTNTQCPGVSPSSENSGVAELKGDGQVSCGTAQTCA